MALRLVLPGPLRELAAGRAAIELAEGPATVREALEALRAGHRAVYDRLLTERGELRPHVNVFVGRTSIVDTGGLETPLADGSEIVILPAVSGG